MNRAAGNRPPSIEGTPPATIAVGDAYRFSPTASDPEGQPLRFSIEYKPGWATFSATDGVLSGTPGPGDVGSHVAIVITVSDGESEAALPAFSIDVVGEGEGAATLSWNPPDENADGTVLTDLSGYRIYYGRHARDLDATIVLDNPGLTRYMVEGLTPGRWHFAMTSVNRDGAESSRSAVVSKTVG